MRMKTEMLPFLLLMLLLMTHFAIPTFGQTYKNCIQNPGFEMGTGLPYWNPNAGAFADDGPEEGINPGPYAGNWTANLTFAGGENGVIYQETKDENGSYIRKNRIRDILIHAYLMDNYTAEHSGFRFYYTKGQPTTVYFIDVQPWRDSMPGVWGNWVCPGSPLILAFIKGNKYITTMEFFVEGSAQQPVTIWLDNIWFRYYV